jgi:hypothetical protein
MSLLQYPHEEKLLRAFFACESADYHWRDGIDGAAAEAFRNRLWEEIAEFKTEEKYDYIVVQSHSNMGNVVKQIVLTAKNWSHKKSLVFLLGTTPRDKVNHFETDQIKFSLRDISSTEGAQVGT